MNFEELLHRMGTTVVALFRHKDPIRYRANCDTEWVPFQAASLPTDLEITDKNGHLLRTRGRSWLIDRETFERLGGIEELALIATDTEAGEERYQVVQNPPFTEIGTGKALVVIATVKIS